MAAVTPSVLVTARSDSALSTVSAQSKQPFGVAGPAALGASTGILVTGMVGIARVGGPSLILFALMMLSAAALLQGWLVSEPPPIRPILGGEDEEK